MIRNEWQRAWGGLASHQKIDARFGYGGDHSLTVLMPATENNELLKLWHLVPIRRGT